MYKMVGNAYILVNASSLMKHVSVWFISYSPHFYGHKKSSEWKRCDQMLFSVQLLLDTELLALYYYNTLINNTNGFLQTLCIMKTKTVEKYIKLKQVTSLSIKF